MELKKYRNKAEWTIENKDRKDHWKDQGRKGSLLAFFHLCLVSVLFSAPSLLEIKFYRNFFPSIQWSLNEFVVYAATTAVGEVPSYEKETHNAHDRYAVAVKVTGTTDIVGHLPRKLSNVRSLFLRRGGTVDAIVTGACNIC